MLSVFSPRSLEGKMPLYEFRCEKCGASFEEVQSIADHGQRRPECPRCHSTERVEPQLSSFSPVTDRKS
jgi:putative FmdB family regulatory protein